MTSVVVVGTGYVGLTAGVCLAHLGHHVICVDNDASKIETLEAGRIPFLEVGLDALVHEGVSSGRLRFALDTLDAVGDADVVLLCLPTPTTEAGHLDLAAIEVAARIIGPSLRSGAVVATKSTVPVGTGVEVSGWLGRPDVYVVSNPEFLREGSAVRDFLEPDRVVVGGDDPTAVALVASLYSGLDTPIIETSLVTAEAIKYAANAMLAVRLSFVNELARVSEAVGADVDALMAGLGTDRRIGPHFLTPGPGWGGSCFPKDTRALAHLTRAYGHPTRLVEAAIDSNTDQLDHVADLVSLACGGSVAGRRIGAWGLAFKAGTDDTRDSPAHAVLERLVARGADVVAYDPATDVRPRGVTTATSATDAARDADALIVLTEWPEFGAVDLTALVGLLAQPAIVDARGVIDRRGAEAAGLRLWGVGVPRL